METFRIITRREWGARYAAGGGPAALPARECWCHHSVTGTAGPGATLAQDVAAVRTVEQIGQDRFGQGMSYTWLITPAGRIFEGHAVDRLGAHTAGRNGIARAICFVGNFETERPTGAALRAAAWLLQVARQRGWLVFARFTGGHRDLSSTACPGGYLYAEIGNINGAAAGLPIVEPMEGFMSSLTPAEQREIYNRVMGRNRQRWFRLRDDGTVDPDSVTDVPQTVGPGSPWKAAQSLDELDGNYLLQKIAESADVDPDELVAAMVANDQFMATLGENISVTLAGAIADEMDRRARDGLPGTGPTLNT